MIKIKLKQSMEDYGVTISELSEFTGIARSTLTPLANNPNTVKGIQIDTIDTLCDFFGIGIDDLLEFVQSSNKYSVPTTWGSFNTPEFFVDLKKMVGAKARHTLLSVTWNNSQPDDTAFFEVSISPLSKIDAEQFSGEGKPSGSELLDGNLFKRDFKRQTRDVAKETSEVILRMLIESEFFKKQVSSIVGANVTWNIGNMLENNTLYSFVFEIDGGNISYQKRNID